MLAPECKVAGAVAFVLVVVATPREALWAYGIYAGLVVVLAAMARVGVRTLVRRLVIETPFLLFVVGLPFLAGGERVDVAGVGLSIEGLWAAWNILVKATVGAATMVLLASTTPITTILEGLQRLKLPPVMVAIAGFMVRYFDVIVSEMRRMKIGRESRGYDARWWWRAKALSASAGTLFIRSYERGERVHLAMLSRAYTGSMPEFSPRAGSLSQWAAAATLPATALAVCVWAWL